MEYPNRTITVDGDNLLGSTTGTANGPVIDKAVLSDQLPNTNSQLANVTLEDITDPQTYKIDIVKHNGNTSQPEITIHNSDFPDNYEIKTIGLLAHAANDNSGNEILYLVATADDEPFIMPKKSDTKFDLSISLPFAFAPTDNVTIKATEAGTATRQDLASYASNVAILSSANTVEFNQLANSNDINSANISANSNSITSLFTSADSNYQNNSDSISVNSANIASLSSNMANNSTISSIENNINNAFNEIGIVSSSADNDDTANNDNITSMQTSISANSTAIANLSNNGTNNSSISSMQTSISDIFNMVDMVSSSADNNNQSAADAITQIQDGIKLGSSDDLNNLTNNGKYYWIVDNAPKNAPTQASGYVIVRNDNGGDVIQHCYDYEGNFNLRTKPDNSSWSDWLNTNFSSLSNSISSNADAIANISGGGSAVSMLSSTNMVAFNQLANNEEINSANTSAISDSLASLSNNVTNNDVISGIQDNITSLSNSSNQNQNVQMLMFNQLAKQINEVRDRLYRVTGVHVILLQVNSLSANGVIPAEDYTFSAHAGESVQMRLHVDSGSISQISNNAGYPITPDNYNPGNDIMINYTITQDDINNGNNGKVGFRIYGTGKFSNYTVTTIK